MLDIKGMFENIGKKIMTLAKVVCWIGVVFSIIVWIFVLINSANSDAPGLDILLAFILLVVGSLFSWISSWILYGFGQLVDDNQNMRSQLNNFNKQLTALNDNLVGILSVQNQPHPQPTYQQTQQPTPRPVQHTMPSNSQAEESITPGPIAESTPTSQRVRLISALETSKQGYCLSCGKLNVTLRRCLLDVDGSSTESYRCEACIAKLKAQNN